MKYIVVSITATALLSGCSFFSNVYKQPDKNAANISGAGEIFYEPYTGLSGFSADGFGTIHYCKLLQHYGFTTSSSESTCTIDTNKLNLDGQQFSVLRDEVQDRVLASSNQKCGHFMKTLYSLKGDTEVFWGGLSTLLSGAGAVLSHAPTAQAFSAGGAATSGIRSELEQAYFANKAIEVITAGIQARRSEVLEKIMHKRFLNQVYIESLMSSKIDMTDVSEQTPDDEDSRESSVESNVVNGQAPLVEQVAEVQDEKVENITDSKPYIALAMFTNSVKKGITSDTPMRYSLNGAIRDALEYHAACSTITGLEVASESIARVENPGVSEFNRFLKSLQEAGASTTVNIDKN